VARTIAIIEDERSIAENTRDFLERAGYTVQWYSNRPDAQAALAKQLPDLAVIDVGLGDEFEGGFDLCRDLRSQAPHLPIIFFRARDSAIDEISGLRLGADDYLTKDISQAQLLARIVALFRRVDAIAARSQAPVDETEIHAGDLVLNTATMIATWQQQELPLTVTEFWMVKALAKTPGHVKSRQQLMDAADIFLDENSINTHIKRIRRKFVQVDGSFNRIKTAYGMGYRWLEE